MQTSITRAIASLRQQTDAMAMYQQQAMTGNRINAPSDDPLGTLTVLASQAQDNRFNSDLSNINTAQTALNSSVSTLTEAGKLIAQARDLAIQGTNPGNDATGNGALAQQADALLSRLVDLANTKDGNNYLYSGTATQTTPFVLTTNADGSKSVVYQGAAGRATVPVSPQQDVSTYYAGSEVFQQQQRGTTVYSGTTGAAAGTGTDSATGQGALTVIHTNTIYVPGSGVQPGAGSAAGDTIIGPAGAHQLTINDTSGNGTSGTIILDNGPSVAFTKSDTNLKVAGPTGELVFVDASNITAGFNGSVGITANGSLSVDGGASSVPINFGANQVVTNSTTKAATNVNSTNIRTAGTEQLNYAGTYDVFQILAALRDDLKNTHGLSNTQQLTSISQRISELDRVHNGVLEVVGEQSSSLLTLQGMQNHVQEVQLETRKLLGQVQGADVSQVVINLQAQQSLLQLTLASTAKVFNQNLLDFIK